MVVLLLAPTGVAAQAGDRVFINLNVYPLLTEVESDSEFTVNAAARLPAGFSYYSFANFGGLFSPGRGRLLVSEQNLRWGPFEQVPVDLAVQDTIRHGGGNDTIQFGLRWRLHDTAWLEDLFEAVHLRYSVMLFPLREDQRDVDGWQVSHVYRMTFPYLTDRLYLSGFLDHNIDENPQPGMTVDRVITETQLGFRLYRRLYAVTEYRINQYRRGEEDNLAFGLELKTSW